MSSKNKEGKVARKYARSLLESIPPAQMDSTAQALTSMAETWDECRELRNIILNPTIQRTQKLSLLKDIAKSIDANNSALSNFLCLLADNRRFDSIEEIAIQFQNQLDELKNRLKIAIISASEIERSEKTTLEEGVSKEFAGLASITWSVDPKLIGGVVMKSGDRMLDASISGSLERIKTGMLE